MPVVWGVYPWDLVLASDMNSGLWVFRVTADAKAPNGGGSERPRRLRPRRRPRPPTAPATRATGRRAPALGRPGRPALGLLAVSLVARSAAARQAP